MKLPKEMQKSHKNKSLENKSFNPLWLGKYYHKPLDKQQTDELLNYIGQLSETGNHKIAVNKLKSEKDFEYIEFVIDGNVLSDDYFILNKNLFEGGKVFEEISKEDEKLAFQMKESIELEKEIFGKNVNYNNYFKYIKIKESFENPNYEMDNKLKIACIKQKFLVISYPKDDKEFVEKFNEKYGYNPNILWNYEKFDNRYRINEII